MWEYESREDAQCGRPQPHMWDRSPQLPLESAGRGEGMPAHSIRLWDNLEGWRREIIFSIPQNS